MPLSKQVDFELFKSRKIVKKFIVTQNELPYDMSAGTVKLKWVGEDGTPAEVEYNGTVSGAGNEEVSFTFEILDTAVVALYEYKVIHTPAADEIPLYHGNITILDETGITSGLDIYILDETPANLVISSDKRNNRVRYWRNYLQPLIDPTIADADLDDDSNWPFLVNVLIAKLVVYDCILLELKNAAVTAAGSTSDSTVTGSGAVKKIETGPSNVEWYDSAETVSSLLKTGANGKSTLDGLLGDTCMLAKRLNIYLPLCDQVKGDYIVPVKAVMDPTEGNSVTDILFKHGIAAAPSQG